MEALIRIDETGADAEHLQWLTGGVRSELRQLDVDDVRPAPSGAAPPGSRGVDAATIGALLVSLGGSAEAINQILTALRSWVGRGQRSPRTVEVTVGDRTMRLTDATLDQQDRLVEEFIRAVRSDA